MPIGSWDENDRRRTGMFEPTERITFRTQIAEVDKDWWVSEIMDMLLDRRRTTARLIAGLRDRVRSQVPTEQGDMFVAVGRVLFLDGGAIWQGDLNLMDKELMLLLRGK